tara:strand:+ start:1868 stop:2680 length:813 start_codon:yes stop_codon:yes gene_type:complete
MPTTVNLSLTLPEPGAESTRGAWGAVLNTAFTAIDAALAEATTSAAGRMSSSDKSKLDGIQALAAPDQTGSEIKSLYEAESNTNAFTDSEKTKLANLSESPTTELSNDSSPALGGNLDVNGNDIVSTSNGNIELDPNGTGQVVFKGNSTKGSGQIVLNCEVNTHGITLKGPPHSAGASYTLTLPNDTGSANQVLKTDGNGVTSWVDQTTGGSYSDSDVDTHLNTSTASTNQILSWNGSDYAWVADQTGGGGGGGGGVSEDTVVALALALG